MGPVPVRRWQCFLALLRIGILVHEGLVQVRILAPARRVSSGHSRESPRDGNGVDVGQTRTGL